VQQAVRHVFTLFARTGSARATVQQFNAAGLLFPVRVRTGAHKGELAWMPLQHWRVLRTLHNPRYAGAFAYGRRRERLAGNGKKTVQTLPREQWIALIPDAHPGYINWQTYETNQRLLLANATAHGSDRAAGPAREGPALLQGLAVCGRCGNRMSVRYHTRRGIDIPDYTCLRHAIQDGGPRCQTVPGAAVDTVIGQLLLDTLTPLTLEVALTVQTGLETRAAETDALRRHHVERARHHADLARRRYLAVHPDNRLVADSLEADWNNALRAPQTARDDYDHASAATAATLTGQHQATIRALATDFPALWSNPDTPQRERKRMVRLLVDDVTLIKTDRIDLHVRLRGGQTTSRTVAIPPTAWQARRTHPDTVAALDRLLDSCTDAAAAEQLNTAGHRSGENKPFTAGIVVHLRRKYHLPSHADRLRANGLLTTTEIAHHLGVHPTTIKNWRRAGILNSHKANDKNERLYEPGHPRRPRQWPSHRRHPVLAMHPYCIAGPEDTDGGR
jgi:hypothetical protein